jgi:signal transduction histidine kinase
VRDQGPGIDKANRERVFDPFFSTRENGTGLGLSIASRLIDEHGGYIEIGDGPEGGADLLLLLPLAAE